MATAGVTSQVEKLHSRLRSKESSASAPSFRIYYGVAEGSVPFRWESRPGTPKDSTTASAAVFRPLTPPPSYYATSPKTQKPTTAKSPKNGLIHAILPKIAIRKPALPPPMPPSPSPSSSSSSSSLSWSSKVEEENDREETSSPTSTLCFGGSGGKRKAMRSIGRHRTPA